MMLFKHLRSGGLNEVRNKRTVQHKRIVPMFQNLYLQSLCMVQYRVAQEVTAHHGHWSSDGMYALCLILSRKGDIGNSVAFMWLCDNLSPLGVSCGPTFFHFFSHGRWGTVLPILAPVISYHSAGVKKLNISIYRLESQVHCR